MINIKIIFHLKMKDNKKMTWMDITYRQLNEIKNTVDITDDSERLFTIAQIVFGEDVLDLTLPEFNKKLKDLEFLKTEIPNDLHVKDIKVNGNEYYFDGLLGNITTAQYIDFQNYQKNGDEMKSFSVFIIPKGHKYNDGYDMEQVFKDILEIPAPVLISASFFFSRQFELFIKIFRRYSIKQMKKLGLPKEAMKNLEKVVNLSTEMITMPLEYYRS